MSPVTYLTTNPLVQHPSWSSAGHFLREVLEPSTVRGYYQPLAMISLMLDYAVAGRTDNLTPFHRTSLILHLANTLMIVWLLYALFPLTRRLPACREGPRNAASPPAAGAACQGFGRPWIAAAVGLLFGLHPMTVETIAWVGERKTPLAAFFALLCLLTYVRYARRKGWKAYLGCLVLYVLALMSKPTSTPLPLVLLLLDFWPLNRLSKRAVLEKIPFLAVGCVSALITIVSQGRTGGVEMPADYSAWRIPLTVCHDILFYPCKMLWPTNLTSHYPVPEPLALSHPMILTAVVGTCVLVIALVLSLRWTRALLTSWLVFLVALFPTMGVIGFTVVLTSDKYAYLPAVGFLIALAWLFDRLAGREPKGRSAWRAAALGAGVLAAAGLLAIGTRNYLQEWQTSERHNFYMLGLAPNSPHVLNDCGIVLSAKGEYDKAIEHLTRAIAVAPSFAQPYNNRGSTYNDLRDSAQAIRDCSKAIELNPDYVEAYNNRGNAYTRLGDFEHAIRDFTKAIELKPLLAEAYTNRGNAYLRLGDSEHAVRDYTKAVELKPLLAEAYNNRGTAYGNLREFNRAIHDYTTAIELKPDAAQIYNNRAGTYNNLKDFSLAIRDCTKALALKPAYAEAYVNRAIAHLGLKEYDQAWSDVSMCRRLGGQPSHDLISALTAATGRSE